MVKEMTFPFTGVIFDMDGVIVDSEFYYVSEERDFAHEVLGLNLPDEELHGMVGSSHKVFLSKLIEWYGRAGEEVSAEEALRRYEEWAQVRDRNYPGLLNAGVAETLAALHARGVRTALASSSPLDNIHEVLDACGLRDLFEVIVSGEQFRQSKPNPEVYLHTLGLLGLPAEACCCIEDSVPGITAGKAAGLTVIAKREDRFGFSQDAADAIIDEIPELIEAALALRA